MPNIALRQTLPPHTGFSDLDADVVYIPPAGNSGYSKVETVHEISGVSNTENTSLMFETIQPKSGLTFAVASGGETSFEPFLIRGTNKLMPPNDAHGILAKGTVLLPSGVGEYESESVLDGEIDAFINRYLDASKLHRRLLREYSKLTWHFDSFSSLPYLRFLGPYGSGKSRALEVVGHISYRGIFIGGSVSGAALFRLMDRYHGTLLIDESDFRSSDLMADLTKILNVGYRRGMPLFRCDSDNNPIPYDPFGPKILTGRARFADAALESRCITIETCSKSIRDDIKCQVPPEFYTEAQELRNKLLRHRLEVRVECDESKLRSLEPRLTEIGAPLLAVSTGDGYFQSQLIDFLEARATERRRDSHEAIFVQALENLFDGKANASKASASYVMLVKDVAQKASELRAAQEPAAATQSRAANDSDPQYFNARKAGQVLRNLGFKPEHTRIGAKFTVSRDALNQLLERYGTPRT